MPLNRSQLIAGDAGQGTVLAGQVQGVKPGSGITINTSGVISVDATTITGLMKLNNAGAYNSYIWPALPVDKKFLQTDGTGLLTWSDISGAAVVTVQPAPGPTPPEVGELWYDTTDKVLKVYQTTVVPFGWTAVSQQPGLGLVISGSAIKVSIPVQSGPPAPGILPAESIDGSLYWDNNLGLLFIRYNDGTSTQWVQVTPSGGGGGGTVTSVDVTGSGGITSTGGPITSSGVITVSFSLPSLPVLP